MRIFYTLVAALLVAIGIAACEQQAARANGPEYQEWVTAGGMHCISIRGGNGSLSPVALSCTWAER